MKKWVPNRSCLVSCLVLVTVPLIILILVAKVTLELTCHEHIRKEIASSGGSYIARVTVEGCAGAAGTISVAVSLRSAVQEPDGKGQTVFEIGSSYGLSLYWEGEQHLLIEHSCSTNVDMQRDRWRNVLIGYRCVDPQKADLCNACGPWREP